MSSVCKMQLTVLQLQHTGCGKHWFKSLFCLIQSIWRLDTGPPWTPGEAITSSAAERSPSDILLEKQDISDPFLLHNNKKTKVWLRIRNWMFTTFQLQLITLKSSPVLLKRTPPSQIPEVTVFNASLWHILFFLWLGVWPGKYQTFHSLCKTRKLVLGGG